VRVKDSTAPALGSFAGIEYFPIDETWRVEGMLKPAPAGATLEIHDVTGAVHLDATPGTFAFEREGVTRRIAAILRWSPSASFGRSRFH
jgi:uncharacterized protein (DUF1684 family)